MLKSKNESFRETGESERFESGRLRLHCVACLICLLGVFWSKASSAQDSSVSTQGWHHLFKNGMYVGNTQQLMPWDLYRRDLDSFGKPAVVIKSKHRLLVRWDSVTIFGGMKVPLWYNADFGRCAACGPDQFITAIYVAKVSPAEARKIQHAVESFSGRPASRSRGLRYSVYYWKTDDCLFFIALRKHRDEWFIKIQKEIGKIWQIRHGAGNSPNGPTGP